MKVGDHNLTNIQIVKLILEIVMERVNFVQALISTNALHDSKMLALWSRVVRQSVNVSQDGKGMIAPIVMVILLVRNTMSLQSRQTV